MDRADEILKAVFTFGGIIATFMTIAGIDLVKDFIEGRRK